jgi:hypothetical protein
MLDRRGFLTAMFGAAVVPKDVLMGLATPEPIKKAARGWVCVWRQVGPTELIGDTSWAQYTIEVFAPEGQAFAWPANELAEIEARMMAAKGKS